MIEHREGSGRSESEERFATIFYRSPVPLIITAMKDGRILDANDAYGQLTGYPRGQLLGRTTVELGFWEHPEERMIMLERFRREGQVRQFETTLRTRGGEIRHVETSFEAAQLKGVDCFISTALDVTERRQAESALAESERVFRHVARMTSDLFFTCLRGDDGFFRVQWLGGNAPRLFGIDNATLQTLGCWRGFVVDADMPLFDHNITGLKPGEFGKAELRIRHEDGTIRHVRSFAEVEVDLLGRDRLFGALEDITERVHLEQQLERQAHTDALTGLINRGHFLEQAEKELSRARRYRYPVALAMFDLDYFKAINDAFGHKTGDQVLQRFASLCRESLRDSDLLARLGGEEFVILFPETTCTEAHEVAERIRTSVAAATLASPHGELIRFTTSIGITELAEEDPAIDALLSRADSALYEAKRSGRNRTCLSRSKP